MAFFSLFANRSSYLLRPDQVGKPVTPPGKAEGLALPNGKEYDVVVVGVRGTAALVLANRLTESPLISVLVLEAGQSGMAVDLSVVPVTYFKLITGEHTWNYTITKQEHVDWLQGAPYPRGKLLGGSSSTNAMMFHHCAPTDYDEWARLGGPGAEGWAYESFQRYLRKIEKFVPHRDINIGTSERGAHGMVETGYMSYRTGASSTFLKACDAAGIPNVQDVNTSKGTLGSTFVPTFISPQGRRVSAESAYLTLDVLARPNLTVATGATVTCVLFRTDGDIKVATGVEFVDTSGVAYRALAKREVIMSAGAIGTPQVLMLSGVGLSDQVSRHNIPLVHELPGVGTTLYDHPQAMIRFKMKPGTSLNYLTQPSLTNTTKATGQVLLWKATSDGHITSTWQEVYAFIRATNPGLFSGSGEELAILEDSTSGPNGPDLELIFSPMTYHVDPNFKLPPGGYCTLTAVLLRPTSVGSITLQSDKANDQPIINPNFLATEHDMEALVRGFKALMKIAKTEPFVSMLDLLVSAELPDLDTKIFELNDLQLRELVQSRVYTIFYPTSTAPMAPLEHRGVVDSKLRVHGIPNLRVVDASTFPSIPSGHTAAPVLALAERASDIIKGSFKTWSNGQE